MKPNLDSARAAEARLAKKIGKVGGQSLAIIAILAAIAGVAKLTLVSNAHWVGWWLLTLSTFFMTLSIWYFKRLAVLPTKPESSKLEDKLTASVLAVLPHKNELNPRLVWQALVGHWQEIFITNHLLIPPETVTPMLSEQASDMDTVWQKSSEITVRNSASAIEPGFIAAAALLTNPQFELLLKHMKLRPEDIEELADWLARGLNAMSAKKQNTGGIGRDWAFGFTPLLDRFGSNISLSVGGSGSHFSWLASSPSVQAIESALTNHSGGVVLVGAPGSGKTSHVFALAQKLIAGQTSRNLAYHQIVGLNATQIISSATGQGQLEKVMNALLNEAFHAGHVILFFDDAELFLQNGAGSFDATRIMQPLLESRAVPVIMALDLGSWQRLKSANPTFAGLMTPVVLPEPPEADVMRVLEDTAIGFEGRHKLIIAFEALREAYNLSGRYNQDKAYPGRAIDLLEQALTHAENGHVVTAHSVQQAIESTTGVKVSGATQAEAGELLNLEDKIHQRMINQSRAVQVVSAALRRNRAGVGATGRPIGSFLFLGPTGVGKTELAKSLAAVYFGNVGSMIRLDMSEYQQESDVSRLLASGASEASSLILKVRQQPFSVVLLDEIEKAHPNVLNLLLQLLDEGQLTDVSGKPASFRDAIIIATSNAGADTIRQKIEQGEELESFEKDFTDQLISSGEFKPELLNRFDEIVLFRPLKPDELAQVVRLMLAEVNQNLAKQNITVELTDAAIAKVVEQGNDPRLGARPMRRAVQTMVEDKIANKILAGEIQPGDKITLDTNNLVN